MRLPSATPGRLALVVLWAAAIVAAGSLYSSQRFTGQVGNGIPGLLAHWTFDQSTVQGTTVQDVSGNNRTGTMVAGPTPENGCMRFDGVDDRIDVPNFDRQVFTFAAWAKKEDGGSSFPPLIASKADTGWAVGYGTNTPSDQLGITGPRKIFLSQVNYGYENTVSLVNPNIWRHIVVTYDGSTAKFYIDGQLDATKPYAPTFGGGDIYHLGFRDYIGTPSERATYDARFKGTMDDVRVYDRVLTAQEVAQIAAVQPSCVSASSGSFSSASLASTSSCPAGSTCVPAAQSACTSAGQFEYMWTAVHNGNFFSVAGGSQPGPAVTCVNTPPAGGWTLADSECITSDGTVGCKSMVCQWKRPTTQSLEYATTHHGAQFHYENMNCESTPKPGYTLTSKVCVVPSTTGGCASDICFWQKGSAVPTTVLLSHDGAPSAAQGADCRIWSQADKVERQCLLSAAVCLSDICLLSSHNPRCSSSQNSSAAGIQNSSAAGIQNSSAAGISVAVSGCSDGIDNDGDKRIDMADPGCSFLGDNDETDLPRNPSVCMAGSSSSRASAGSSSSNSASSVRSSSSASTIQSSSSVRGGGSSSSFRGGPGCGDGIVQSPEQCDDGNAIDTDACTNQCRIGNGGPCGNASQCQSELCVGGTCTACDTTDECPAGLLCLERRCVRNPVCGNGKPEFGESCDDGDTDDADVCSNLCRRGNNLPCDKNAECASLLCINGLCAACTSDAQCSGNKCVNGRCGDGCGDGKVKAGEACDAGDQNSDVLSDHCRLDCNRPACGDGVQDAGEQCDDGNAENRDGCTVQCLKVQVQSDVSSGEIPDAGVKCRSDEECPVGSRCIDGSCVNLPLAAECTRNDQCASGVCLNGFCAPNQVQQGSVTGGVSTPDGIRGDSGPATIAVMGAGAAAGWAWMKRRRKGA